ncbi:MAG: nitroreductase family deazaflavin-dependent oxidoreductase [Anaerolineaceae bacterium]|nr:nitroreductase family deazaflavin-dependent oxidoreductase [Anaerolineaceae bacterium]
MTQPKPPTGIKAFFWRLPIWIFRLRLDFLLGKRMMLLRHIGRSSGKERMAVIEVARYDAATDTYYACSGFGQQSNWYRNIGAHPDVTIRVGGQDHAVTAEQLSPAASGEEMVRYATTHPNLARRLAQVIGYEPPESLDGFRSLAAEKMPFVAFRRRA